MNKGEKSKHNNTKRKRCPPGMHYDKVSGECKPKIKINPDEIHIAAPMKGIRDFVGDIFNVSKETPDKRKRCPKGQHYDPITKLCIQKHTKTLKPKPIRLTKKNNIQSVLDEPTHTISEDEEQEKYESDQIFSDSPEIISENPLFTYENEEQSKENIVLEPEVNNYNQDKNFETEKEQYKQSKQSENIPYLYPDFNDAEFAYKIASKKEFADTEYDGSLNPIEDTANAMCNSDFELMPHQIFVRNFLSYQTPYNSLLLYHGLGSGKTCSAIGVAEEMRTYMKQTGLSKTILVVASPNVQDNFRLQLFDERKLKEVGGQWNLNVCIGNTLLNEINPTSISGLSRERIIMQINTIIRKSYEFMGYNEFANYINRKISVPDDRGYSPEIQKQMTLKNIQKYFNDRLLIIDEIHNLTLADNKQKRTSVLLQVIAKHSTSMRLLLLSATPMYNSPTEIVWLANLMNINDKRASIKVSDVFDSQGNFIKITKEEKAAGKESGKNILRRKLTGYVSYVRGENPYTFPYRVYPNIFAPAFSVQNNPYPEKQMNQKPIDKSIEHVPVYLNEIGEYQEKVYQQVVRTLDANMDSFEDMEGFGYTVLLGPLASLIITYPSETLDKIIRENKSVGKLTGFIGEAGLNSTMTYIQQNPTEDNPIPLRHSFQYKPEVLKKYGPIFKPEYIGKYSAKIAQICRLIKSSKGIILIYSQFIDGGAVPMALALEEMGFGRFSTGQHKNLFKKPPTEAVDALTMKPRSEHMLDPEQNGQFNKAQYMMITGHKEFSPDNYADVNYLTTEDNKYGAKVKVVLISKAAAEGLDFKHIRQVHILEPWYNMNRIEQIIGRGVRNGSHCKLPFEERNVEIYLHGSLTKSGEEAADLYVYRLAERKAKKIGEVTRVLKEIAVDCILNISQTNLTEDKLYGIIENQNIKIRLSSGPLIKYKVGDKPYTDICDYMENCFDTCHTKKEVPVPKDKIDQSTYEDEFMKTSLITMMKRIRDLFREKSIYSISELIASINISKTYPEEQIYYALTKFVESKSEVLIDKYGRSGYMVNRGSHYLFQPREITDENASVYERVVPIDHKRERLLLELPKEATAPVIGLTRSSSAEYIDKSSTDYDELIHTIESKITEVFKDRIILTGSEKDWYKHANNILNELLGENIGIPHDTIRKYVIYHFIDMMQYADKVVLLENMSKKSLDIPSDITIPIYSYFDEKIVPVRSTRGIALAKGKELICLVYNEEENNWVNAKSEDEYRILTELKTSVVPLENMFPLVGFIHLFNPNYGMAFKLKNMVPEKQNKNNKGARADQAPKPDLVNKLNMVLEYETDIYNMSSPLRTIGISVMLELIMRFKTDTEGANMFFNPELALVNKIVDL
jgi:hypothetical protein